MVFIFVPLIALTAIVFYVVAVFASHQFLTIIENTAHGNEKVRWSEESFLDWLWKPFYLAVIASLWGAPAVLAGLAVTKLAGIWAGVSVGIFALMWLYPIGQLSAFVSEHPWIPFHHDALIKLMLKPGVFFSFSLLVLALVPLAAVGAILATQRRFLEYGGPLVGSLLAAAVWLFYARLVGRMLFVITYEKPTRFSKADDLPLPVSGAARPVKKKRRTKTPATKPKVWDSPESLPPMERPKRPWDDEDDTPYGVHQAEVHAEPPPMKELAQPKESEIRLIAREAVPAPTRTWGPEVWSFLFETETARCWLLLSFLLMLFFGVIRAMIETFPEK